MKRLNNLGPDFSCALLGLLKESQETMVPQS